jgi:hypothetical protein
MTAWPSLYFASTHPFVVSVVSADSPLDAKHFALMMGSNALYHCLP